MGETARPYRTPNACRSRCWFSGLKTRAVDPLKQQNWRNEEYDVHNMVSLPAGKRIYWWYMNCDWTNLDRSFRGKPWFFSSRFSLHPVLGEILAWKMHGSNKHRGGNTSPLGQKKALWWLQPINIFSYQGKISSLRGHVEIPALRRSRCTFRSWSDGLAHGEKRGRVRNHRVLISLCNDLPCFWKYPNKNRCSGDLDSSNRRRSCWSIIYIF